MGYIYCMALKSNITLSIIGWMVVPVGSEATVTVMGLCLININLEKKGFY